MAKHTINMIFATGCDQCKSMRQTINSVVKHENLDAVVVAYNCNDDEAIDIALDNGISDVPGCCVDGKVFEGEDFDLDGLVKALKELS